MPWILLQQLFTWLYILLIIVWIIVCHHHILLFILCLHLFLKLYMRHFIIIDDDKPWFMKCWFLLEIAPWSFSLFPLKRRLLVISGFIIKVGPTMILSLSWPKSAQVSFFFQWLLFTIGHFTNLTLKVISFTVILRRKATWRTSWICYSREI